MLSKEMEDKKKEIKEKVNNEVDKHFQCLKEQRDVISVDIDNIEIEMVNGEVCMSSTTETQDLYEYINNK